MEQKPNQNNKPKKKISFYWIYAVLLLVFFGMYFMGGETMTEKTTWNELEKMIVDKSAVDKIVVVNDKFAEIYIKPSALENDTTFKKVAHLGGSKELSKGPHYNYQFLSVESLENQIDKATDQIIQRDTVGKTIAEKQNIIRNAKIPLESVTRTDWLADNLSWIIYILLFIVIWIFIMRSMNRGSGAGQIFNVGKSKAQLFDKDTSVSVTFKDVAGLEEAKVEVMEVVDFLKNPKKYTNLGGKIPKGVLLVGPPGTGKTLLAKAVAGEAKVPFFSISGSEFVEMFVGVGASRVRDLFRQAKEKAPCIVFIDEIDAIGRARGKNLVTGGNDERENTLNQLLTEMDGFGTNAGVIILAATNRADILDKALLRAGRFDRQIYVELPDLKEREEIFKVHLAPLKIETDINPDFLARQTPGFSGADIANVCNEAALIGARKGHSQIDKQDFLDAIDRIIAGLEKRNKIISVDEKKIIAYHEAGHATVSWLLEHAHPLVKVTIVPRGKALGAAWYLPEERSITQFDQIIHEMSATLGGRVSEEVIFGKISTGALNDLERVTKQAYASVVYYGFNPEIGNLSYFDSSGQQEYSFQRPYSEKTAELIDQEIRKLVDKAYQMAKNIITENKEKLTQLAELLLEKEVIFREDVEAIFGPRPNEKGKEESPSKETENNEKEEEKNTDQSVHF